MLPFFKHKIFNLISLEAHLSATWEEVGTKIQQRILHILLMTQRGDSLGCHPLWQPMTGDKQWEKTPESRVAIIFPQRTGQDKRSSPAGELYTTLAPAH